MKDSENKFKISRKTRSRAYQFIKSLMNDDIAPDKIHNLMDAIREHVDKDVAGDILFDLLKNPKDPQGDINHYTTWFGPVDIKYHNHVFEILTEYLETEDMRGWARFGNEVDWDEWNSTVKNSLNELALIRAKNNCQKQLIYFEYWGDCIQNQKTKKFVANLFKKVQDKQKKNA